MDFLDPTTWPVPQIDLWFAGIRGYYSRFMRVNAEYGPLIVWTVYFTLSWLAYKIPWVKTNKIPELIVSIFRGDWLKWWRERKAVPTKVIPVEYAVKDCRDKTGTADDRR